MATLSVQMNSKKRLRMAAFGTERELAHLMHDELADMA